MTDLIDRMIPTACQLVGHVHDHDKRAIYTLIRGLSTEEAYALVVVLAAMIPQDNTPSELLAWTEQPPTRPRDARLRPCGTHAAYARHKTNNEPIDNRCLHAERAYQRDRKRQQRQAVTAAPREARTNQLRKAG